MTKSSPIKVKRNDVDYGNATDDGMPLPYIAALFKGTLQAYPGAVLLIFGSSTVASRAQEKLERSLGVPLNKIEIIPISDYHYNDAVEIVISYFPDLSGKRKVWVEFKVQMDKVEVEFEFSPDKALLEEVKVEWSPLKMLIKKHSSMGLLQNIKVATKINSSISFDRETLAQVETSIKNKLKTALFADVKIPGTKKPINVEFYGAGGFKYKLKDGTVKPVFEVGIMLTVPFDFL